MADVICGVAIGNQKLILPRTCTRVRNNAKKWRQNKITFALDRIDVQGTASFGVR